MARALTSNDVEWQECRKTIGRLDSTLADFRKYGFTLVTALITASGYLGQQKPTPATTAAVPAAIMMLIAILFALDRYYSVLLSGAVERALDIEGPSIDKENLKNDDLTQVIAVHAIKSGATYITILLYILLLVATLMLAKAMGLANALDPQVGITFYACLTGILAYSLYTEVVNKTGYFRKDRDARGGGIRMRVGNWGMLLLAVYMIIAGLESFGFFPGIARFGGIVGLIAGILILRDHLRR